VTEVFSAAMKVVSASTTIESSTTNTPQPGAAESKPALSIKSPNNSDHSIRPSASIIKVPPPRPPPPRLQTLPTVSDAASSEQELILSTPQLIIDCKQSLTRPPQPTTAAQSSVAPIIAQTDKASLTNNTKTTAPVKVIAIRKPAAPLSSTIMTRDVSISTPRNCPQTKTKATVKKWCCLQ
jgi:hypothetical protein